MSDEPVCEVVKVADTAVGRIVWVLDDLRVELLRRTVTVATKVSDHVAVGGGTIVLE